LPINLLSVSMFLNLLNSIGFCISNSYLGSTLSLDLLLITLLLNLKVLLDIHLCGQIQININSHYRIKICEFLLRH
jgi:hypothetical protein